MDDNKYISKVLKLLALLLMLAWCFLIIQPFILIILWGLILAVAFYPVFSALISKFGSKKKLGTIIFTVVLATMLFVPMYFFVGNLIENTKETVVQIQNNSLEIPMPNDSVKDWPLIGEKLHKEWYAFSSNVTEYAIIHKDIIIEKGKGLLSNLTGFIGSYVSFIISFFIAIVMMYKSDSGYKISNQLMVKLVGDRSEDIITMSRDTIRSVVKGILLVAIIQSMLAFVGFKAIDLPAAEVFALGVLIAAIVQLPVIIIMLPAIIIAFSISDTTHAVIFTVYCGIVGLADNVLKPILMGKGLQTPMIVILIGTIGGMMLHGIIGLFIGAVVLAVMHRIYMYWVNT